MRKLEKNSSSVMYVPSWSIHSQLLSHFDMNNKTYCYTTSILSSKQSTSSMQIELNKWIPLSSF